MHVVVGVNVINPRNVCNLEFGFANTTDETNSFNFLLNIGGSSSLVSERIDDDTEENVHQDDIDEHEEREIKQISEGVVFIRPKSLPKSISKSTSTSHAITCSRKKAICKRRAIHIVSTSWRHWSVILVVIGPCIEILPVV